MTRTYDSELVSIVLGDEGSRALLLALSELERLLSPTQTLNRFLSDSAMGKETVTEYMCSVQADPATWKDGKVVDTASLSAADADWYTAAPQPSSDAPAADKLAWLHACVLRFLGTRGGVATSGIAALREVNDAIRELGGVRSKKYRESFPRARFHLAGIHLSSLFYLSLEYIGMARQSYGEL